ncbi:uncharacterized protein K460DRAFT_371609 [Cucurbitaria berberidis CBS 394.84]|uniref:Uncharacterized protein n=1 Tax=Cucurbitaria berberidis CBS 394.84 TaxID=1168544 RepID=A0A9P4G7Z3_9PLEO|nr:uncharacterized protein K460DRAFT_371609 [Cucurbitaria berberidis CBS 394.84]KAF1840414.1 hypothetical protein K460DRAFT_371609 [Cucurbitaria berberidis CBS 394.84]
MCWRYDLMSDQKWKWGKNYFRADEVTDTIIGHWLTCTYIGETTADDDKIRALGMKPSRY